MEPLSLSFVCNGEAQRLVAEPRTTAAELLREQLGLTGTHVACQAGVCGACTVLLDGDPVRACLVLAVQLDGTEVTTVEGLAGPDGELHPVQQAFVDRHSFQCGFCAPGVVVSTVALLEEDGPFDAARVRDALADAVCRCTGYQSIIEGVLLAAERAGKTVGQGGPDGG